MLNFKRILAVFVLVLFGFCGSALAIPSEGSFLPKKHHTDWGFQYNWVVKRDFTKVKGKGTTTHYFLAASYGLSDRFCLDGKVGVGRIGFRRDDNIDMNFTSGFTGGYGFRYLLKKPDESNLGYSCGFQHISTHPYKEEYENKTYRVIWDEWQGSLLCIKKCPQISYYLGAQYSYSQLIYKVDRHHHLYLKTEDVWGLIIGADHKIGKNANLNMEVRLVGETGFNVGIMKRF